METGRFLLIELAFEGSISKSTETEWPVELCWLHPNFARYLRSVGWKTPDTYLGVTYKEEQNHVNEPNSLPRSLDG